MIKQLLFRRYMGNQKRQQNKIQRFTAKQLHAYKRKIQEWETQAYQYNQNQYTEYLRINVQYNIIENNCYNKRIIANQSSFRHKKRVWLLINHIFNHNPLAIYLVHDKVLTSGNNTQCNT